MPNMENSGSSSEAAIRASEVYQLLTSLVMHSEDTRWTRVNTLLVVESIFLAAWAGLFAGTGAFWGKEIILTLLCIPGLLLGISFALLGWRSSEYLDEFHKMARKVERRFPDGIPRPLIESDKRRQGVVRKLWRLTSSKWLVTAIPLMFSAVFSGFIAASWLVTP